MPLSTGSFKIRRLRCEIRDHALRPHLIVVSCAGRHDRSRYLLMEVTDSDGRAGWGEAALVPIWSGEWTDTAVTVVERLLRPVVEGRTIDHPAELSDWLDAAIVGQPFTKAAIETAGWDLWGRRQNASVLSLVTGKANGRRSVPSRASIGAYDAAHSLAIARHFWDAGVRCLKFKVGVPGVDDIERLRVIRGELGDDPVFTLDANGGYATADEALHALEALLPFGIELFEQPTPRDRLDMLAEVHKRSPVSVMADESIFTPGQLEMALNLDAFDCLSVYPGKNGGFGRSLQMARTAVEAGKSCAVGSNLETDMGLASMVVLGAAIDAFNPQSFGDFASSLYYVSSSARQPLCFEHGELVVPTGPGFGVEPAP